MHARVMRWSIFGLLAGLLVSVIQAITWGTADNGRHPATGALIAEFAGPGQKGVLCSGILIAPHVFLTAAHCAAYLEATGLEAWVSFDEHFDQDTSPLYTGTMTINPLFNGTAGSDGDMAVFLMNEAKAGALPAALPKLGLLDDMKKAKTLVSSTKFTNVGYGGQERLHNTGGGKPYITYEMAREYSVSSYNSLSQTWLHLSMNQSHDDGGTCYGDSGGPVFLGAGTGETNTLVALTIKGDSSCTSTAVNYRLDTPGARAFLGGFVALP